MSGKQARSRHAIDSSSNTRSHKPRAEPTRAEKPTTPNQGQRRARQGRQGPPARGPRTEDAAWQVGEGTGVPLHSRYRRVVVLGNFSGVQARKRGADMLSIGFKRSDQAG